MYRDAYHEQLYLLTLMSPLMPLVLVALRFKMLTMKLLCPRDYGPLLDVLPFLYLPSLDATASAAVVTSTCFTSDVIFVKMPSAQHCSYCPYVQLFFFFSFRPCCVGWSLFWHMNYHRPHDDRNIEARQNYTNCTGGHPAALTPVWYLNCKVCLIFLPSYPQMKYPKLKFNISFFMGGG